MTSRLLAVAALLAAACLLIITPEQEPVFKIPNRPGEYKAGGREGKLKPGDMAADFTLSVMRRENTVTLSSFRTKRPVALIFGSYT